MPNLTSTAKRPVYRRTWLNKLTLSNLTGVSYVGTACVLDSSTGNTTDGQAASIHLTSAPATTSSITIDLQTVLGGTINMTAMDYLVFFVKVVQYTASGVRVCVTHDGTWTNYSYRYLNTPATQVNSWIAARVLRAEMGAIGSGATWSAIRYIRLEATGVSGAMQDSWWQSFAWMQSAASIPTSVDGYGTTVLSMKSPPAPYYATGCTWTQTVLEGRPCVQVLSQANTDAILRFDLGTGFDFTSPGYSLQIWRDWQYDGGTDYQGQFYLSSSVDFSDMVGCSNGKYVHNPGWNEIRWAALDVAPTCTTVNERYLQIRVPAIAGVQTSFAIGDFAIDVASQPVVILNFDDGDVSMSNIVYPLLQQYNLPATAFVVGSLIDTSGYCTTAQLQTMYASGLVEIGNHSADHANLNGVTDPKAWQAEYGQMQDRLRAMGFTRNSCHKVVAYPNGSYNRVGWQVLKALGVNAARSVVLDVVPHGAAQGGALSLPIAFEAAATDTLATWQTAVQNAVKIGGLAVCLFHSVVASGATGNQVNSATLQSFLQWLALQQASLELKVMGTAQYVGRN